MPLLTFLVPTLLARIIVLPKRQTSPMSLAFSERSTKLSLRIRTALKSRAHQHSPTRAAVSVSAASILEPQSPLSDSATHLHVRVRRCRRPMQNPNTSVFDQTCVLRKEFRPLFPLNCSSKCNGTTPITPCWDPLFRITLLELINPP